MFFFDTFIRVRYAETDQMGYVYYGNYPEFYEVGRVETMRELGISYKTLEDAGCMMPILSMNIKYYKPARYDDKLMVRTFIKAMPSSRIKFEYQIFNEENVLLNEGETILAFIKADTRKPIAAPPMIIQALEKHFKI